MAEFTDHDAIIWIGDMIRLGTPGATATCQHCGSLTLYIFGRAFDQKRKPLSCGRWVCDFKLGLPTGKGYVSG